MAPMMSGMAANCSQPSAQVSITFGLSLSRSSKGSAKPWARARSKSMAFAACRASVWSRSSAARLRRVAALVAASALAISAEAALACWPKVFINSTVFGVFMAGFSHRERPNRLPPIQNG